MSNEALQEGTGEDFGYADAYDDEDDASKQTPPLTARTENGDDRDDVGDDADDDDNELAEMFAKVQTIQQAEGIHVKPVKVKPPVGGTTPYDQLEVSIPDRAATTTRQQRSSTTPNSGKSSGSSSRTVSPAGSRSGTTRSPDGITTISRRALATGQAGVHGVDVLAGVKKPSLFQDRLLQTAKQQPQALQQLTQKVVAAAPAVIAKRVEALSEPKKSDTGRKFALDDDEKHCRFRVKKKAGGGGGRDAYEDDEGGRDRTSDFLARMEATERNKQKRLELTRGEKDYLANLNKKVCPKCDVPQSYSEYRDKKKRCQTCGSEFRVPQAWGDIGAEFIGRISEDSRTREERRQQIRSQVIQQEVTTGRVTKSATQQLYEKTLQQRNEHKTFLDRNYSATAKLAGLGDSSSNAKTKQAQLQLQMQLQAQRAKLLAAAQPPIY